MGGADALPDCVAHKRTDERHGDANIGADGSPFPRAHSRPHRCPLHIAYNRTYRRSHQHSH